MRTAIFALAKGSSLAPALLLAALACGGGGTGPEPTVSSVTVALTAASIEVGQTAQATATLRDANGDILTGAVTWSSSSNAVATVSNSGLVTGASAGTANIIAASGGVQGQAALTVTSVTPQISGLTLKDANGQPLVLGNVAGDIALDFNLTVPAGTTGGTLIVTLDDVEFARQPVNAAPPSGAVGGVAAHVTVASHVDVNTATSSYTVSNNLIQQVPLAGNGDRLLRLLYLAPGATQPSASTQSNVVLANPDGYTGRMRPQGGLTLVDGVPFSSNNLELELIPLQFGGASPQSVEVRAADYQADFGTGGLAGVVNIVTRTGSSIPSPHTLLPSSFQYESKKSIGTNFFLPQYSFGGTASTPQTAEPRLNGNCLYTRGTGFIQPVSTPSPVTLPSGCTRWVRPNPLPANLLTGGYFDISAKFFHDTRGPTGAPGAVTPAPRTQTAGASAFGSAGGFGVMDSYIGSSYDFPSGVDKTRISDAGSGIDLNQSFELHSGFSPGFTPGPGTLVTNYGQLAETGAVRTRYFTTGWRDKLGNLGYIPLTTNAVNPYTTGNQLSANLGIDPALVSINNTGGTSAYSGPWDRYVLGNSSLGGLSFGFSGSGSPVGYGTNSSMWARVFKDFDLSKPVYGEGASTQTPWWVSSAGGSSLSASLSYSTLMAASAARYGGTGEGVYTGYFGVVDKSGSMPTGGSVGPIRYAWDYTAPTAMVSGSGPFVSGNQGTVTASFADNVGLEKFEIGPIFNLPHTGFDAGFAYVTPGQVNIGGGFGTALVKNFSLDITDLVPDGLVFYAPTAGTVSGPVYNTIGVAVRAQDLAWNRGSLGTLFFSNPGSFGVPASPTAVRFSISTSSVCRGSGCLNGSSRFMTLFANWDSPTTANPFNKFEFYSLTADKRVNFLAAADPPTVAPITGGFRFSAQYTLDWGKSCQPGGVMQLIGLGQSANRRSWFKNNFFYTANLSEPPTPDPYCWTARVRGP